MADHLFDLIDGTSGFFDALAGLHPDVHVECSGIDRRGENLAKKGHQTDGDRCKAKDKAGELAAVAESETQQVAIALSESFESMFKTLMETGGPTKKRKPLFSVYPRVMLPRAFASNTSPRSVPAFATGCRRKPWRRSPLRPTAKTGIWRPRKGKKSGQRRCGGRQGGHQRRDRNLRCAIADRLSKVGFPSARCRSIFSMVTVASSTRMPTAKARPPNVMILSVCPRALSTAMKERMARGIEIAMIRVLFQSPRKRRIMIAVETRRDHRFAHDAVNGPGDEDRLVCQR